MFRVVFLVVGYGFTTVLLGVMVWAVGFANTHEVAQQLASQFHRSTFANMVSPFGKYMMEPFHGLQTCSQLALGGLLGIPDPALEELQLSQWSEERLNKLTAICAVATAEAIDSLSYVSRAGRGFGCYTDPETRIQRFAWTWTDNATLNDCALASNVSIDFSNCHTYPFNASSPSSGIAFGTAMALPGNTQHLAGPIPLFLRPYGKSAYKLQYILSAPTGATGFWKGDRYLDWLQGLVESLIPVAPSTQSYVVSLPSNQLLAGTSRPEGFIDAANADHKTWPFLADALAIAKGPQNLNPPVRFRAHGRALLVSSHHYRASSIDLLLLSVTPEDELLRTFTARSKLMIGVSCALTVLVCASVAFLLWQSLAKPLRSFVEIFRTFPEPANFATEDVNVLGHRNFLTAREIIVLQDSFVAMVDHLRTYISELKLMTAKATAVGEERMQFLSVMSHEIRTPLNAILCSVDHLASLTGYTADQAESIALMKASSEHLLTMLNNILDLTKLTASELTLEIGEFSVADEVGMAIQTVAPLFSHKGLELVTYIARDVPAQLVGDPTRIRQILVNLLTNACKFTPSGHVALDVELATSDSVHSGDHPPHLLAPPIISIGSLSASTGDGKLRVRFAVRDTGVGIPASKLGHVFERFKQCHEGNSRQFAGVGLGLTITAELCQLMGGGVSAESEEGSGSTFTVVIPLSRGRYFGSINGLSSSDYLSTLSLPAAEPRPDMVILPHQRDACNARFAASLRYFERYCQNITLAVTHLPFCFHEVKNGAFLLRRAVEKICNDTKLQQSRTLIALPITAFADIDGDVWDAVQLPPVLVLLGGKDSPPPGLDCRQLTVPYTPGTVRASIITAPSRQPRSPSALAAPSSPSPPPEPLPRASTNALLVDDNSVNLLLLTRILTSFGCICTTARSGKEAVDLFLQTLPSGDGRPILPRFDLVFMDIQMPEMDGNTATRLIREKERVLYLPPMPIIACTAHAFEHDRQQCLHAGMNDYITKPYAVSALRTVVSKYSAGGVLPCSPGNISARSIP